MPDIADDWNAHWDDYGDTNSTNPAQIYRQRILFKELGDDPKRVIDVGSGSGEFLALAAKRYPDAEFLGIEPSETGVSLGRSKVPRASFLAKDLLVDGVVEEEFRGWATHAVCSEVLEHVDAPSELIGRAAGYMGDRCRLVVTVPAGPMSAFDRHIGHRRHFRARELRQELEDAGFRVESVRRAGFPFFNLYRLMVVLRGEQLVDDVASGSGGAGSRLSRVLMRVFRILFRLNLPRSPWGWQLVAVVSQPPM